MIISEKQKSLEQMSFGVSKTISDVMGALIRELPKYSLPITTDEYISGFIPDLKNPGHYHKYKTKKIFTLPLTGEPQRVDIHGMTIDGDLINSIKDLKSIGMGQDQIMILENNAEVLDRLHKAQKIYVHKNPKLIDALNEKYPSKKTVSEHEYGKKGNVFRLLSTMPQMAAFILTDALGNIEVPYGSSLGYTLVGEGAKEFHSCLIGSELGPLQFPFVKPESPIKTYGQIPDYIQGEIGHLLRNGYIAMHPYNEQLYKGPLRTELTHYIDGSVLMSKRSWIPLGEDFQIKTSFGARIMASERNIHFSQAINGIENSNLLIQMAKQGLLPDGCYIYADKYACQVEEDDSTTYVLRSRWNEIGTNHNEHLPENSIAITPAALLAKNMLSSRPLIEDFAEAGMDPIQLGKEIIQKLVETQLEFMSKGYMPEMHAQNTILLIDKNTHHLTGLILRDHEGAKVNIDKIEQSGFKYEGVTKTDEHARSPISEKDPEYAKLVTGFLHRFVFTGIITPLILTLQKRFYANLDELCQFTKDTYVNWWKKWSKTHHNAFEEYCKSIYPSYIAVNGTMLALNIKIEGYPSLRSIPIHPFIPTHEEMKAMLSS